MQADVDMMQQYVSKYDNSVMTSVLHLREALVFLTEKPEILQQAVFVDILRRHEGKVPSKPTTRVQRYYADTFEIIRIHTWKCSPQSIISLRLTQRRNILCKTNMTGSFTDTFGKYKAIGSPACIVVYATVSAGGMFGSCAR